jgi:asparagine synthase (glutamine-hydrolysing)
MCGIAGFWRPSGHGKGAAEILRRMTQAISHRGPDDEGHWVEDETGVALGQRRLAIVDLSAAGHQPMASPDGRYKIIFNGEIYNFPEMRQRLEAEGAAPEWRGHSDTEVLLAAISAWGLDSALRMARGMFALALWDRERRVLSLARDRMGEKPLYFGWCGSGADRTLLFGSDLAALREHPVFAPEIDPDAVALLTQYLHIPEPRSIYRGIEKLMPGVWLEVDANGDMRTTRYWDTVEEYVQAAERPFDGSDGEAADAVEAALTRAVREQSVADVPLGAFLSGGIDSSTIVALMQATSSTRVKTFSIGFTVDSYNEAPFAAAVAGHLGTEHHELIVSPQDAQAVIPKLPQIYSEPFADSSQIPTFLVAQMAREHVTVSLSGDAGDELFGGYNRHVHAHSTWPKISGTPVAARRLAAACVSRLSPATLDRLGGLLGRKDAIGEKLHKAANVLAATDVDQLYRQLINVNASPLTKAPIDTDGFEKRDLSKLGKLDAVDRMMALDAVHYLPGDILAKVDRAAMANSLETRVPFLDPDVMKLAWSMPAHMKIRGGTGKLPVRGVLDRYVPRALVDRPKAGFGIPIHEWLRGPLKPWAHALLEDRRFPLDDYFDVPRVTRLWEEHQSGRANHQHRLWPVLMFQAWRSYGT